MFCSKCGGKITDNSVYCLHCGTRINMIKEGEDIKKGYVQQQKNMPIIKPKNKIACILLFIFSGICLIAAFMFELIASLNVYPAFLGGGRTSTGIIFDVLAKILFVIFIVLLILGIVFSTRGNKKKWNKVINVFLCLIKNMFCAKCDFKL